MRTLPKVYRHNLAMLHEGIGSSNQKEYCNCIECNTLRLRRDSIFNKPKHKIARYFNKHF